MKDILKIFILLFSSLFLSCGDDSKKEQIQTTEDTIKTCVDINGQLRVESGKIVNYAGNNLLLRGVSLGWHNWWPKYFSSQTVKWLSEDWNCNIIRAAIGVEPDGAYSTNKQEAMLRLNNVVDAAIKNGIYVIIDWHAHELNTPLAIDFFTEVSQKYGSYPNVIYEIFNEPMNLDWSEIKKYSEEIIKTIRIYDTDNIIVVGTPNWSQDVDVAAKDPIVNNKNVMYALHYYAATHTKWLRDKADVAISKGLPLFVTECGATEANGAGRYDFDEWNNWHSWMEKNSISWITWGIFDKNELTAMLKPGTAIRGWAQDDLTEWGRFVKNRVLSDNR